MKRILALVMALAMLFTLAACGTEDAPSTADTKVLKVGMECDYAPFNWSQDGETDGALPIKNVDGMYTNGYDVQVAKNIADALGYGIEIYSYEWDSLVPAVEAGTLDLIIAGMSPTDERKEKIDFTDIYYNSNLVIITKKDKLGDVKTIADLDGKKISAQTGTSHLDALTEQTKADVKELDDFSTMLMALQANTIDGYVAEEPTAMAVCTEESEYTYIPFINNDTGFKVPVEDTSIAVGVKKDSELTAKINDYLKGFDTEAQKALMQDMVNVAPVD